jgi:hypothetical protein
VTTSRVKLGGGDGNVALPRPPTGHIAQTSEAKEHHRPGRWLRSAQRVIQRPARLAFERVLKTQQPLGEVVVAKDQRGIDLVIARNVVGPVDQNRFAARGREVIGAQRFENVFGFGQLSRALGRCFRDRA